MHRIPGGQPLGGAHELLIIVQCLPGLIQVVLVDLGDLVQGHRQGAVVLDGGLVAGQRLFEPAQPEESAGLPQQGRPVSGPLPKHLAEVTQGALVVEVVHVDLAQVEPCRGVARIQPGGALEVHHSPPHLPGRHPCLGTAEIEHGGLGL
jgi:hypothetical protein